MKQSIKKLSTKIKSYSKSDLTYDSNYIFQILYYIKLLCYCDMKKFDNHSLKPKHSFLLYFFDDLNKFIKLNPQKEETEDKKTNVYQNISELYNRLLEHALKLSE